MLDRVLNGVDWLNYYVPGWENHINLRMLDLGDPSKCVIGQLGILEDSEDYYNKNLKIVYHCRKSIAWDATLGFHVVGWESSHELTNAWREVIDNRRKSLNYNYLCITPYTQAI